MQFYNFFKTIKSWDEFKTDLSLLTNKEKGDAFELLSKHYLQIDPKFKTLLKEVWLLNDLPTEKKKLLNLPDRDMGIDLVAETKQGEYWAIQCKYRDDETGNLTWKEISTFTGLTFGRCRNFSFGLICSTTEKYTSVLKDQDNIGFCTSEIWESLDKGFFDQLHALLEHKKLPIQPFLPRPHQEQAIENALYHFVDKNNERGKLIMPCGTGKSLTAFWIADALKAKTILIAVPSLALISQTLKVWLRESLAKEKDISWLCVCSDESVGNMDNDEIITHIQDLLTFHN